MNYNGERRTYIHDDHVVFMVWSVRYGGWIPSLLTHGEIVGTPRHKARIYQVSVYSQVGSNLHIYESTLPVSSYTWESIPLTCNEYGEIVSWPYMTVQEAHQIICLPDVSVWIPRTTFLCFDAFSDVLRYENATFPKAESAAYYHNEHSFQGYGNDIIPALGSLADMKKEKAPKVDDFFTTNEKMVEAAIRSIKKSAKKAHK